MTEHVNTIESGVKVRLERHNDAERPYVVSLAAMNPLGTAEIAADRLPELMRALSDAYLAYLATA